MPSGRRNASASAASSPASGSSRVCSASVDDGAVYGRGLSVEQAGIRADPILPFGAVCQRADIDKIQPRLAVGQEAALADGSGREADDVLIGWKARKVFIRGSVLHGKGRGCLTLVPDADRLAVRQEIARLEAVRALGADAASGGPHVDDRRPRVHAGAARHRKRLVEGREARHALQHSLNVIRRDGQDAFFLARRVLLLLGRAALGQDDLVVLPPAAPG